MGIEASEPPILPPLKTIYDANDTDLGSIFNAPDRCIEQKFAAAKANFKAENTASTYELLLSFYEKFSDIEHIASKYVVSTYSGQLESIDSKPNWMQRSYKLMIEDPFDQTDNTSRAVSEAKLTAISDIFKETYQQLSSYFVLSDREKLLHFLVRPEISKLFPRGPRQCEVFDDPFSAVTAADLANIEFPHEDLMVITADIGKCRVHRILISGSGADIITIEAFERMQIGFEKLRPFKGALIDICNNSLDVLGQILLPLKVGNDPRSSTVMVNFFVVNVKIAYNVILGTPAMGLLGACSMGCYLTMIFPTPDGIGKVQGDQKAARKCAAGGVIFIPTLRVVKMQSTGKVQGDQKAARSAAGDAYIPSVRLEFE